MRVYFCLKANIVKYFLQVYASDEAIFCFGEI